MKHFTLYEHDHEICCPSCGLEDIWVEAGDGDYYDGPQHICGTCHESFYLKRFGAANLDDIKNVKDSRKVLKILGA